MAHRLASFARYMATAGHVGPLTVELMADWARQAKAGHGDRASLARRLKMLRPFTAWLRQFEPATEVPDEAVFGRVPGRMTPHIYREPEIVDLPPAGAVARAVRGHQPAHVGAVDLPRPRQGLQHLLVSQWRLRVDGPGRSGVRALRQPLGGRR